MRIRIIILAVFLASSLVAFAHKEETLAELIARAEQVANHVRGCHVDQQQLPFDQGRAADPEVAFGRVVFFQDRLAPDFFALVQIQAMEHSLGPEGVDAVVRNYRSGARPIVGGDDADAADQRRLFHDSGR